MVQGSEDAPGPLAGALVPLVAGVLAGGLAGARLDAGLLVAGAVVGGITVGVLAWRRHRHLLPAGVMLLAGVAMALGARLGASPGPEHLVHHLPVDRCAVEGVIVRQEPSGDGLRLTLRAGRLETGGVRRAVRGLLAVRIAHPTRPWPVGARVRVVARLRRPRNFGNPGGYDYAGALRRRGILATAFVWDDRRVERLGGPDAGVAPALGAFRRRVRDATAAVAAGPVRAYLDTVLVGAGGALDPTTRGVLARTGLAHVASVSGFHVAVVAGATYGLAALGLRCWPALLLRCDPQRAALWLSVLPVLLYAGLTGGRIPIVRAVLMYATVAAARLLDRPPDSLRALALAALVLALGTPDVAADLSFQLSFVTVGSLLLALPARPPGAARAPGATVTVGRWAASLVRVSTVAALAAAPLTAWHFQQVSLIAPVANLVALPVLGPATLGPGLAGAALLPLVPSLAHVLLALAAAAADLGLRLAAWLAQLPGAGVATPMPTLLELAVAYGLLGLLVPWPRAALSPDPAPAAGARRRRLRRRIAACLAGVLLADVGYWVWERRWSAALRVTFLSVGQGDATVVELPRGPVLVVDGGGLPGPFDPGERLVAPFLRRRKILSVDVLVLSHPQHDHYEGLTFLAEHFRPRELWWTGARAETGGFARLVRALAEAGVTLRELRGGDALVRGGVRVEVLHPRRRADWDVNDGSLVLRLAHGATSILLPGDVEAGAERALVRQAAPLGSTVLKVPHHGSATSSTASFVAAVAPRVAIVSSGWQNRFGFPHPVVLRRLLDAGATVWRTDLDGAIQLRSDGRRVVVRGTRGARAAQILDL